MNQRNKGILEILKKQQYVKISELADIFKVSQVTIRKDIANLENAGIAVRFHGKVALKERETTTYTERSNVNKEKKELIAQAATELISPGASIILDAGTTSMLIAQKLLYKSSFNIATNSIPIATCLSNADNVVNLAGGILLGHSICTAGPDSEAFFGNIQADISFIGCSGIRNGTGLSTGMRLEGCVKKAMIDAGIKVVAVFDDSKFENSSMYMFADFSDIDTIITTHGASAPEAMARIKKLNIELIYAD